LSGHRWTERIRWYDNLAVKLHQYYRSLGISSCSIKKIDVIGEPIITQDEN
jgi:hypothetical protein